MPLNEAVRYGVDPVSPPTDHHPLSPPLRQSNAPGDPPHPPAAIAALIARMAACPPDKSPLAHALECLAAEVQARGMALHLLSDDQTGFVLAHHHNLSKRTQKEWEHLQDVVKEGQIALPPAPDAKAQFSVPIVHEQRTIGILTACWDDPKHPTDAERALLQWGALLLLLRMDRNMPHAQRAQFMDPEMFIGMLRHDLQSLLSTVIGYAELLLSTYTDPLSKDQEEYIQTILENARRAAHLITMLSEASQLASGQLALEREIVRIRDIWEEAIQQIEPYLTGRNQKIRLIDTGDSPMIQADPQRLPQALGGLLRFIARHLPSHSIIVLRILPHPDQGIVETRIERAQPQNGSKPGYHATPPKRRSPPLPLVIAYAFIEAHGGRLTWFGPQSSEEIASIDLPIASSDTLGAASLQFTIASYPA